MERVRGAGFCMYTITRDDVANLEEQKKQTLRYQLMIAGLM